MRYFTLFTFLIFTYSSFAQKEFNWLIEPQYDYAESFNGGLAEVGIKGIKKFIDKTGEVVVKAGQYDGADIFSEGLAAVEKNDLYGYINKKGKMIISPQFEKAKAFNNGLAAVRKNNRWGFISKTGDYAIMPQFQEAGTFAEGLALVKINGLYGFINRNGITVIEAKFPDAQSFNEGMAVVKQDGKYGFIDKNGKFLVKPQFSWADNFHEGFARIKEMGDYGFIDLDGEMVIEPQFEDALEFGESLAAVKKNGSYGYIDKKGAFVIQPQFYKANTFTDGAAVIVTKGERTFKYGFIENPIPLPDIIKEYALVDINEWQKRGKYEKIEDYERRVNKGSLPAQLARSTQKAVDYYGRKWISLYDNELLDYDPDFEAFVVGNSEQKIFVSVPVNEAEYFEEEFEDVYLDNAKYALKDGKIVLSFAEAVLGSNKYIYNGKDLPLSKDPEIIALYKKDIDFDALANQPALTGEPSDVDINLPKTNMDNPDAVAVVIGNAYYEKTKNVDFALNDAITVRKYLIEVMGFKEENIIFAKNATINDFNRIFGIAGKEKGQLYNYIKPNVSNVFVYYSGHGAPGLNDKQGYFVPTDCDPQYIELEGYSSELLFNNLSKLPAKSVNIVLDACFSGIDLVKDISPVKIRNRGLSGMKNGVVLSSSADNQYSAWYRDKQHGLFTYFFLKAIHSGNADKNRDKKLTFTEIYDFTASQTEGVPYMAKRLRNISQIPKLQGIGERVLVTY